MKNKDNNVKFAAELNENSLEIEVSDELLEDVNGGGWAPWAIAVAAAAVCSALNDIHDAGKNAGKILYYATH